MVHYEDVRGIMGCNLFGPEEWNAFYGVNFTEKQLQGIAFFPWGKEVLMCPCPFVPGAFIKDTHFAFLGISRISGERFSINKWHAIHPKTGRPCFYFTENFWYKGQPYAERRTVRFQWYLVFKEILPDSTDKNFKKQRKIIPWNYEVPATIVEVTKNILYFQLTGMYLNPMRWAVCKEKTKETSLVGSGYISCVGLFGNYGLMISPWHGRRHNLVGVAASRRPFV